MQYFSVQGMTCQHCVKAVGEAIRSQDATAQVEVDLAAGRVGINSALPVERLLLAIQDSGYTAQPAGEVR
ncbi:heavy-metal-associated domain-containing protein [Pseudomonas sp. RIT-PI-S]|uniref:heavy-metal-associated domain-containing protein n=1 Tax=Pseudomonas sp. RIT-PI-S TaxID=3035295 RepID=UPI0021D9FA14|nr:heavy-metal-associated domain-containing protein [Pseudomonas sp. RIT-PI-S]